MVAYTDSLGINKGSIALASSYTNRFMVMEYTIDFAKIAAARSAAGATALANTDTLVLATLPKGSYIVGGSVKLLKAEGAVTSIDLGTSVTPALFANNFACGGTVGTMVGTTTAEFLAVDTNVELLVNNNSMDVAKVLLSIIVIDAGTNPGSIPNAT